MFKKSLEYFLKFFFIILIIMFLWKLLLTFQVRREDLKKPSYEKNNNSYSKSKKTSRPESPALISKGFWIPHEYWTTLDMIPPVPQIKYELFEIMEKDMCYKGFLFLKQVEEDGLLFERPPSYSKMVEYAKKKNKKYVIQIYKKEQLKENILKKGCHLWISKDSF